VYANIIEYIYELFLRWKKWESEEGNKREYVTCVRNLILGEHENLGD
jgi:hypothetical protein